MENDEIHKEIERRKKRAEDLNLRESLWSLFRRHLEGYAETLKEDPAIIYPVLKETIAIENDHYRFTIGRFKYELIYKPGKEEKDAYGPHKWDDETVRTPILFSLLVDDGLVFGFNMTKSVQYTPERPLFDEYMGDVTAFIEGPWVAEFLGIETLLDRHRKTVWDERSAPKREQELLDDMKRFGM
jgi:hypothetical protein